MRLPSPPTARSTAGRGDRVVLHRSLGEIASDWEALCDRTSASPFGRPEWFGTMLGAFMATASPALFASYSGGQLTGVLPLVADRGRAQSITNTHTPSFGAVAGGGLAVAALAEAAARAGFHQIDLSYLDRNGLTADAAELAATAAGYRVVARAAGESPYVSLEGSWEDYEARLSRKLVKEVRRCRRRLAERGEVRLDVLDGAAGLPELLEDGFRLEASGWKLDRGAAIAGRPARVAFYTRIAEWAAARGTLRLVFLRVGGRAVAFDFCLEEGGAMYALKGGFDPEFREFGPGMICTYDSLAYAHARGLRRYEFLGASDPYKLRWTNEVRPRVHLQAYAQNARGTGAYLRQQKVGPQLTAVRARVRDRGAPPAAAPAASGVRALDSADPRWDEFVRAQERAGVYHLSAWPQVLHAAYGFKPMSLALERDGELRGVLPLVRSIGVVSGKRLRSLPAGLPPAGPLALTRADEVELLRGACGMAAREAKVLTVLSRTAGFEQDVEGLVAKPKHPTWITPLPADPEELRAAWRKSSKNLHRSLNKAAKSGVTVREGRCEADLRAFYRLYLGTMKAHHSLPRSFRQLVAARDLLGPDVVRVFLAEHAGAPVAAGVFHTFNGEIELLYNASEPSALDLRPNHALYWHVMQWGIENGYRAFDFGQAKPDSDLERFKAQWSAERVPEYRYDYVVSAGAARAESLRHAGHRVGRAGATSRRDELVARAWSSAPLPLTQAAGALVYRFL